jgi:hypothetical protein
VTIPSTPFDEVSTGGQFSLQSVPKIIVDCRFGSTVNKDGHTLIPPTLAQFSETFEGDLKSAIGGHVTLKQGDKAEKGSIFLTIDTDTKFSDVAGRHSSEGYSLTVTKELLLPAHLLWGPGGERGLFFKRQPLATIRFHTGSVLIPQGGEPEEQWCVN